MKRTMWGLLGGLGLIWSALGWMLYGIAGSGGPAVMAVTRWLDMEPARTQWLADGLAAAGGLAQGLVIAGWLLGLAVLGLIGWMGGRAGAEVAESGRRIERERAMREGAVLEGEVRQKSVSRQAPRR